MTFSGGLGSYAYEELTEVLPGEGPFYTEYLYKIQEDNPNAGLLTVVWDESLTNLNSNKDAIIALFNSLYSLREIGAETEERWQINLQQTYDRYKRDYNHYFSMYSAYDITDLGRKIETVSNSKFQDTPVTPLDNTDYATTKNDNTTVMTVHDEDELLEVNRNIKAWNDLIKQFVDEFNRCFISTLGRI